MSLTIQNQTSSASSHWTNFPWNSSYLEICLWFMKGTITTILTEGRIRLFENTMWWSRKDSNIQFLFPFHAPYYSSQLLWSYRKLEKYKETPQQHRLSLAMWYIEDIPCIYSCLNIGLPDLHYRSLVVFDHVTSIQSDPDTKHIRIQEFRNNTVIHIYSLFNLERYYPIWPFLSCVERHGWRWLSSALGRIYSR